MTFSEYQEAAAETAVYPSEFAATYPALGLCGEAGEVCNLVKKAIRDDGDQYTPARLDAIGKELGDVLWYVAMVAYDLELDLDKIARGNIDKLRGRKERGTLHGSGDAR